MAKCNYPWKFFLSMHFFCHFSYDFKLGVKEFINPNTHLLFKGCAVSVIGPKTTLISHTIFTHDMWYTWKINLLLLCKFVYSGVIILGPQVKSNWSKSHVVLIVWWYVSRTKAVFNSSDACLGHSKKKRVFFFFVGGALEESRWLNLKL